MAKIRVRRANDEPNSVSSQVMVFSDASTSTRLLTQFGSLRAFLLFWVRRSGQLTRLLSIFRF